MAEKQGFLKQAYKVENAEETQAFYADWAASYDVEVAENGYVTPRRCAQALADVLAEKSAPVLDFGCGTGLSGLALKEAGFQIIDGSDVSENMLKQAHSRTNLYRNLTRVTVEDPLPFDAGQYHAIAAMGVLATNHAPATLIDDILLMLSSDGVFVFSLNDHTLENPEYEARIAENIDTGQARILFKEYGDHLPGIDMKSVVYILQKV